MAWTPLQHVENFNYGPDAATGTLTFPGNCTSNSLITFFLTGFGSATITVTDGINTYGPITGVLNAGYGNLWTFSVVNTSTAALTLTWHASATVQYPAFQAAEWSGNTATPFDAVGTAGGSGITHAQVAANGASVSNPELIIGMPIVPGGGSCTPDVGWTAVSPGVSGMIYSSVTANGNYNPTFVVTPSGGNFGVVAVSFFGVTLFSISGNAGVAGALISYTGTSSGSVVADGSGNYTFSVAAGTYTITPSLATYTFSPTSQIETVVSSNIAGVNFTPTFVGGYGLVNEAHDFSFLNPQPSLTLSVTKGNLLVAWMAAQGPGNGNPVGGSYGWTLYDGLNTYYPVKLGLTAGYGSLDVWIAIVAETGTVNANFFGYSTADIVPGTGVLQAARQNLSFPICQIAQFSDPYGNPLDEFAFASGSTGSVTASVIANAASELIIGVPIQGSGTLTPAVGWTQAVALPDSLVYAISTGAGTYSPTWSQSPDSSWGVVAISLKSSLTSVNHTISGSLGISGANANVVFISTTTVIPYSTTADASGNYVSPGLADDTYLVMPQKVGVLFTSTASAIPQAEVVLSGANSTGNNFTTVTISADLALTTTFTDTMIRANENPLSDGGIWTGDGLPIPPLDPQCQLLSNECVMSDATIYANFQGPWSGDGISIATGITLPNNQFAQFRVDDLTNYVGAAIVQCRTNSNDFAGYLFGIYPVGSGLVKFNFGVVSITPTQPFGLPILSPSGIVCGYVWSSIRPFSVGDTIGIAAIGTTIYFLHNGTVIGNYSDANVASGTGCIVLNGEVIPDAQISHFTAGSAALIPTFSISGNVGMAGVTINYTGPSSGSVVSGAGGAYTILGLLPGTYTITPVFAGFTFSPASTIVVVTTANVTGINFTPAAIGTGEFPPTSIYAAGYQPHTIVCGTMRGPAIHDFSTE